MARKLKTYETSIGFFDLAIAAPSMKAAAEAWGTDTDIFKKGFAKLTDDPEVVAATMGKPGVVLKRPVGSDQPFSEQADLPHLAKIDRPKRQAPAEPKEGRSRREPDDKAHKLAALAFDRERKRREAARQREEAARERRQKNRDLAVAKSEKALEDAKREHDRKIKQIELEQAALDERSRAEEGRWERQKEKLESALRRARD
jgi:colicin import membrane protein